MTDLDTEHNQPFDKSNFRKVTITLPHDVYQRLMEESVTRKIAGAPNQTMSALLREALLLYFEKRPSGGGTGHKEPAKEASSASSS
jgi:transcriptional regulator of met regulon